jgi:large subunit ribosomal protein L4
MKLPVYDLLNQRVGEVEVSDENFAVEVRPHLHHEAVRHYLARQRSGTHATLNRRIVSGSTRKLYKQKGVGRARHGSVKANNFVGGGIVFGPMPRDYSYKLSKKFRRAALRSALSEKVASGALKVVSGFDFEAPKTKRAAGALRSLEAVSALVVDNDKKTTELSFRNLEKAGYSSAAAVSVYAVLRYPNIVITVDALKALDGALNA